MSRNPLTPKVREQLAHPEWLDIQMPTNDEWKLEGNCLDMDPGIFVPSWAPMAEQVQTKSMLMANTEKAKKTCWGDCPVRLTCLRYALDNGLAGVWGGLSEKDRRDMIRAWGDYRRFHGIKKPVATVAGVRSTDAA
jgi:hypothetical protein